jgi:hypothetical protein
MNQKAWLGRAQWLMAVIPPTQEAEIRRIAGRGQLIQNVSKIPSQQRSQAWWYMLVISATQQE